MGYLSKKTPSKLASQDEIKKYLRSVAGVAVIFNDAALIIELVVTFKQDSAKVSVYGVRFAEKDDFKNSPLYLSMYDACIERLAEKVVVE